MKAVRWHAPHDVRVETVADPSILNPRDAIIRVNLTAICGSDLHLCDGAIPSMEEGDVVGHEPMGNVVEVGNGGRSWNEGRPGRRSLYDRLRPLLVLPAGTLSLCDISNPNAGCRRNMRLLRRGMFGYSHLYGGSQAAKRSTFVFLSRTSDRLRSSPDPTTSRRCFFPTSFRPATWRRRMPRSTRGYGRRLGMRPGWPVHDPERLSIGRRTCDRDRPRSRTTGAEPPRQVPRQDTQLRKSGCPRSVKATDRRTRTRRLHRRRRI